MSLGMPGKVYVAAKDFDGQVRYLVSVNIDLGKLAWSKDRARGHRYEYREVSRLADRIPGVFHAKAVTLPTPQAELSLF